MNTITLTLPFPPSVNGYWRNLKGRTLISKRGRQYKDAVWTLIRSDRVEPMGGQLVSSVVVLHPPDKRRRDHDNYGKGLYDALTHAGVLDDDTQVRDGRVVWGEPTKDGVAIVTLTPIGCEYPGGKYDPTAPAGGREG